MRPAVEARCVIPKNVDRQARRAGCFQAPDRPTVTPKQLIRHRSFQFYSALTDSLRQGKPLNMPRSPDEVLAAVGNALLRGEHITGFEIRDQLSSSNGEMRTDRTLHFTLKDGPRLVMMSQYNMEQGILTLTAKACPRILVDLAKKCRRIQIERQPVVSVKVAIQEILKHFSDLAH